MWCASWLFRFRRPRGDRVKQVSGAVSLLALLFAVRDGPQNLASEVDPNIGGFTLRANHVSAANKYIESATLNGKPLDRPQFSHADIVNGGTLILDMGPAPNENLFVQSRSFAAPK